MSLSGKVVVIPGATGVVASGAVRRFLDAGATVVGISRSMDKLHALRQQLNIHTSDAFHDVVGDFKDEASAYAAKLAVEGELSGTPIDHVVSAVGFVTLDKAPTQTPLATAKRALDDGLYTNFLVAKSFLPELKTRDGASFTLVSGGLAHVTPSPVMWLGTLKNAAVNALSLGLAAETANDKVRVNTLCVHMGVAPPGGHKNQFGMPAEKDTFALAPAFLGIAKGNMRGQVLCLHTWADVEKLA